MRLYSTPQSALNGEVTVLAILETVVATAFAVWLVVHRGTLTHVVIGACVAPFLLLRTDESTELAIVWFKKIDSWFNRLSRPIAVLTGFVWLLLNLISIRPLAIAFTALRSPLRSIAAIPDNWNRVVLATDLYYPPEMVPDAEVREELYGIRFSKFVGDLQFKKGERVIDVLVLVIGGSYYLLPFLYRYSLKATSIVYLPIVWILHDSLVQADTLNYKLADIAASPIEKLKRWYSWFVIVFLLLIPAGIYFIKNAWWKDISSSVQSLHPAAAALMSALLPTAPSGLEIHGWHLARGINAVLTLMLFQWTYNKLREMERGVMLEPDASVAVLNVALLVRGLLTLYIIGCTLYIIIVAVSWNALWPFHVRWFPRK